jgi:hypothetical protein
MANATGNYGPQSPGAVPVSYDPQTGMVFYSDGTSKLANTGPVQADARSLQNFQGGTSLYSGNIAAPTNSMSSFGNVSNTTDTGGTAANDGYPKAFEGNLYNTPEELANAIHASALVKYNENAKTIDESYKKGLITYDEYLKMARDNAETVKKTRDQNLANIQGYFNKIAPDAVQSQQGVMQDSANADYNKVQANTGDLFGGRSASDIAAGDLSQYANDLTTTGKIARGIQGVNDAKTASVKNNNDYMNSVNWDNFAMLHPSPTSANTSLTDFLQNLATQVYAGQGTGGGITGTTKPVKTDAQGRPIDDQGNIIPG